MPTGRALVAGIAQSHNPGGYADVAARRTAAVVLGYDAMTGDSAPRVLAKGYGQLAERIVERAHEAGLYVHRSPEMVSLLMQADLDQQIPPALYQAVAELLAWIYQLEHAQADCHDGATPAPAHLHKGA